MMCIVRILERFGHKATMECPLLLQLDAFEFFADLLHSLVFPFVNILGKICAKDEHVHVFVRN